MESISTRHRPFKLLLLEDDADDALLVERELRAAPLPYVATRVSRRDDFARALRQEEPDLILSDYSLPGYDGMSALREARQAFPHIPFIFVSGHIGEERAIRALKEGATDYVLKDRLKRLGPVVLRALEESEDRKERQRAEQRLRLVTDALPVLIAYVDRDRRYRFNNRAYEEWFGLDHTQVEGRTIREIVGDEAYQVARPYVDRALAGERVHYEAEVRHPPNELRWVSATYVPDVSGGGEVRGFYALVTDVTERKRGEEARKEALEERVRERTGELEEVLKELDAFAYTVAHDLRAPLRAITGFCQALVEDFRKELGPTGQEYARRAFQAARRMNYLIEDLLHYSRLSRERIPLDRVDLDSLVGEVLKGMAPDLADRDAEVVVRKPLLPVRGFAPVLHQVIWNLVSNAVKFVAAGARPRVVVWTEGRQDAVRLWVEDNGIGIKPEHQAKLFRVFERLHGPETYAGTGIGLAIVRRGIERMKGRVGVESEVGKGSRFWIELPASPPQSHGDTETPASE